MDLTSVHCMSDHEIHYPPWFLLSRDIGCLARRTLEWDQFALLAWLDIISRLPYTARQPSFFIFPSTLAIS
jgi:hypothetical protein